MDASHAPHGHGGVATVPGLGGLPTVVLTHPSGARAVVYLHGAQVASWTSPGGQEALLASSAAVYDGVAPVRGGIPIAFPQFAKQGPLAMHGFARTSAWEAVSLSDGGARAVLRLRDSPATRAAGWDHAFELTYTVALAPAALTCVLRVANPPGAPGAFAFEALLHGYFRLSYGDDFGGVERARVGGGLARAARLDKPTGGARVADPDAPADAPVRLGQEVDRVYLARGGAAAAVRVDGVVPPPLREGARAYRAFTVARAARVARAGGAWEELHAPDVVLWNPGPDKGAAIADLGEGQWKQYVCVEPGRVSGDTADEPGALRPGDAYELEQTVRLEMDGGGEEA